MIASSTAAGSGSLPRSARTNAVRNRSGVSTISALLAPFVHSRPTFPGWVRSPDTLRIRRTPAVSDPTSSTITQPTPQYEHTVRTLALANGSGALTAAPPRRSR